MLALRYNGETACQLYINLTTADDGVGYTQISEMVGWLVVLGLTAILRQYFSLHRAVSQRGRKKREMVDERKMSKQPPPAATARAEGPCSTLIQISRTPRHWKFIQHHRIESFRYIDLKACKTKRIYGRSKIGRL